jgi:serine/threonine protein kinase
VKGCREERRRATGRGTGCRRWELTLFFSGAPSNFLGMEYLHSKGVFHRDLTSKNILVIFSPEKIPKFWVFSKKKFTNFDFCASPYHVLDRHHDDSKSCGLCKCFWNFFTI